MLAGLWEGQRLVLIVFATLALLDDSAGATSPYRQPDSAA